LRWGEGWGARQSKTKAENNSKSRTLENFFEGAKAPDDVVSAAKLIPWNDVRGEETFARRGCGTKRS
jgi:hypothetical protein